MEVAYEHDHAPENDRSACMKVHVKKLIDKAMNEDKSLGSGRGEAHGSAARGGSGIELAEDGV